MSLKTYGLRFFKLICLLTCSGFALSAVAGEPAFKIATKNGEAIFPTLDSKRDHDLYHFTPARRAGNMVYLSGLVVERKAGEGTDRETFKRQVRRAFEQLREVLKASGADFDDVVMVNTFHEFQGPNYSGTRNEQFDDFSTVLAEYIKPPYPAWTAVGTTDLLTEGGIIEIQLTAHVPDKK